MGEVNHEEAVYLQTQAVWQLPRTLGQGAGGLTCHPCAPFLSPASCTAVSHACLTITVISNSNYSSNTRREACLSVSGQIIGCSFNLD